MSLISTIIIMKVGIITILKVNNYGAELQAYATQAVLKKMGYDAEIIDYLFYKNKNYQRTKESAPFFPFPVSVRLKEWVYPKLAWLKALSYRQANREREKRFADFHKENTSLSKTYHSIEELYSAKMDYDVYMTGSDQVWGPVMDGTYDSAYCLSFTNDCDRRVAFAASFGRTEFTETIEAYYKKWLSQYHAISVREDSAVQLLAAWGINAQQVVDPTLVLDHTYWDTLALPIKEQKYILIYQIGHNKKMDAYAKAVAKRAGLPLVRVSASFHQIIRGGKFKFCPDIGEFLSYIRNAQCLITDSFHGTAFALNFNTPFVEVLPGETSTRNMSILRLTGLTDRILKDENDVDLAFKPIDFTHANEVLTEKRKESLSILKEMLGEAK